jgi:hypothetical protein
VTDEREVARRECANERGIVGPDVLRERRDLAVDLLSENVDCVLRGEGVDANQLDEVISKLKELEDDRAYQDIGELARSSAIELYYTDRVTVQKNETFGTT